MTAETSKDACLRSFLDLLAERPISRIDLTDVAARSGIALAEMRASFVDVDDLLAAFFRATDRIVLAEGGPDSEDFAGEGPKERLFEVLMRRLEALEPHRAAVRGLGASARRDPLLALRLLHLSSRSQRWMLAAAGIEAGGLSGALRAKGLAVLFARVIEVWLADDEPGLARTMAALDKELEQGGRVLSRLHRMKEKAKSAGCGLASCRRPAPTAAPVSAEPEPDLPATE